MSEDNKKKTVLLVEDDFWIREVYKMALNQRDINVVEAADGQEAINMFNSVNPDLILLDIMLPVLSGIDVLKYVRDEAQKNRNTPIFLITNVSNNDIFEQASEHHPDGYYLKSQSSPQQLVDKVIALLAEN